MKKTLLAALLSLAPIFAYAQNITNTGSPPAPVSSTNPFPTYLAPNTIGTTSGNPLYVSGGGGGGGGGTTLPVQLPSANGSSTITAGGTFQTLLSQNSSRKGCYVQNPPTATELLYIYVYAGTTGTPAVASSIGLGAGAAFTCAVGGYGVITDQIAVEAATTGHAFVEINQ